MDEITQVKNRFRLEQWTQLIKDYQSSDMTVKAWCEQNGVKQQSYYYWLKKIRKAACGHLPATQTQVKHSTPTEFAKLQVTPPNHVQAAVIIHLPYASVEVAEGTSRETIEAVLVALKNIC
ncbi:transposase [Alkalibaculum bacchi]|uniref:IS66 family insertion sequence element accessory protein TnpA n=1 Tax=Alkalibaculum bacchi TaxID=645887 RepID=UPI0026E9A8F8|nr:transposase [Alkalibaculum bacchi]